MAAASEVLAARLAGLAKGPGMTAARADAAERLAAMGLPGRRDEYWRWTDPAALNAVTPAPSKGGTEDETPLFDGIERVKIVFVDGVFDAQASDDLSLAGVEISLLSGPVPAWAVPVYGSLEAMGQSPVNRPFAALNTAQATEGMLIRVRAVAAKPINLIYVHKSDTSDPILHHLLCLDPGAEMTLLEQGPIGARANVVLEVDVAAGARFHHIRAQGPDTGTRAITHVFARIKAGALFKSFTLSVNGALTRNEAVIDIVGDDACAHVAGAALGDGATGPFLHDDTIFVTHGALRGESRQVFKKVLKHGAIGTFQGKILVKPGAQKTDGYQISQSLLLDDDSQFLAKPELEIYADDVKCSHGSTTGAIDETALFYLRSRGVPDQEAKGLLVLSFLADAIEEIENDGLKQEIVARLETWLARHKG